jgi:hypothetical protein
MLGIETLVLFQGNVVFAEHVVGMVTTTPHDPIARLLLQIRIRASHDCSSNGQSRPRVVRERLGGRFAMFFTTR